MWSHQDERQFIGRSHRFPQIKHVIVYRPFALQVNEKNLAFICWSKESLHASFVAPAKATGKH